MSSYNYQTGVSKRPLAFRVLCGTVNFIAVLGWLVLLVIIITIITNTFDELIIILWEI